MQQTKTLWLRPTYSDIPAMKLSTELLTRNVRNDTLFLCMMFHSNEFEVNASPYSLTRERLVNLQERLDGYLRLLKENYEVDFISLSDSIKYFKR